MKTRRRLGGKSKTNETKAAATGANIALIAVMFEFFVFIMDEFTCF
jgi:hypothetical protein